MPGSCAGRRSDPERTGECLSRRGHTNAGVGRRDRSDDGTSIRIIMLKLVVGNCYRCGDVAVVSCSGNSAIR